MRLAIVICLILLVIGGAAVSLYKAGELQFNDPSPSRFPIHGIDVSHHQGAISWQVVAGTDVQFAFIKATEGRDFTDKRFEENWSASRSVGIPRGAYHFFTFCSPGDEQARHFLATVPVEPDALPPVADVEFVGNCKNYGDLANVRKEVVTFVQMVEAEWGRKPILYLTPDSLERVIGEELQGYPIWIRSVFTEPALDDYRGWAIWQYADNARVDGIRGPVDRNVLRPEATLESLSLQ